jgi:hypothetical protein
LTEVARSIGLLSVDGGALRWQQIEHFEAVRLRAKAAQSRGGPSFRPAPEVTIRLCPRLIEKIDREVEKINHQIFFCGGKNTFQFNPPRAPSKGGAVRVNTSGPICEPDIHCQHPGVFWA